MLNFDNLEDAKLITLLKDGDKLAFTEIYDRYWLELYNKTYKRTQDKEQCQDIVQNVFTDLWLRRGETAILNLQAYLHTAVRYQLYKQVSRFPFKARYLDKLDEIIRSPVSTDDMLREKEILEVIRLWLAALPERRRQIFILHYKDELSTREIASTLNISQNTVQAQLYTAKQSLRIRLTPILLLSLAVGILSHH